MTDRRRQDTTEQEPELARLKLEHMGTLGDTIAYYEGEPVNVFGGIVGEEVVARIVRYRRRRRHYVSAIVTEVLTPSPHRVTPPCPYFGPCSGCQWQHIEYSHQLQLKREAVERELARYPALAGVIPAATVPGPDLFSYRNHARFTVRGQGVLGYVNRITRRFVRIDECMLMTPWINDALQHLQGKAGETTQLSVRYGQNSHDWLIQPTLKNPEISLPSGQSHYREKLLGRSFRIASPSFFQVNTRQTEAMTEMIRQRLEFRSDELLVDAYTGVGVFAVLFAPHVARVVAIEESSAAVKDAKVNAEGIPNLEFREGKTEDVLGEMEETPDVVILDPPRAGCHPDALSALICRAPRRVAYVSCDPAALARDLDILVRSDFRVRSVEPVDMFPQTHHVECIAILEHTPPDSTGANGVE